MSTIKIKEKMKDKKKKASQLSKRRGADKVRKQARLKHDLSPVQLFLTSVSGIAVLFCVLCLKLGYPDSFHYDAQYGVQSPPKINFGTQHRTLRFNVEL